MPDQEPTLIVSPWNDLVWDMTWHQIVSSRGKRAIELTAGSGK